MVPSCDNDWRYKNQDTRFSFCFHFHCSQLSLSLLTAFTFIAHIPAPVVAPDGDGNLLIENPDNTDNTVTGMVRCNAIDDEPGVTCDCTANPSM